MNFASFFEQSLGLTFSQKQNFIYFALIAILPPLFLTTAKLRKQFKKKWGASQNSPSQAFTSPRLRWLKTVFYFVGVFLSWIALLGPQWGQKESTLSSEGLDICFALDLSQSMLAEDTPPSRLKVAKNQLSIFLPRLGGDRVALVGFAGSSFVASPLTPDKAAVIGYLEPLDPSYISNPATRLEAGIEGCLTALGIKDSTSLEDFDDSTPSKIITLISDGEDPKDDSEALERAIELKIPIFTMGVGTIQGGSIPRRDERGELLSFLKDPRSGKIVNTQLALRGLEDISERTGGETFNMSEGLTMWDKFENALNRFSRESRFSLTQKTREERFQWVLFLAFVILFFDFVFPELGFSATGVFGKISKMKQTRTFLWLFMVFGSSSVGSKRAQAFDLYPEEIFLNRKAFREFIIEDLTKADRILREALVVNPNSYLTRANLISNELLMALKIESKKDKIEALKKISKRCTETIAPFDRKFIFESQLRPNDIQALKVLQFQCGTIGELINDASMAFKFHYQNLHSLGVLPEIEKKSQYAIERLFYMKGSSGSQGSSGDEKNQNPDKENSGSGEPQEGEGDQKKENPQYTRGQDRPTKPKFSGTEVSEGEAKKILESVSGEEQGVQKRKAQAEAREASKKGNAKTKGQGADAGNPW